MTNTPAQYEAIANAHHTRPQGGPWATSTDSWCVELVFLCGGFARSFDTATLAGDYAFAQHRLDSNWESALVGEFDYWTDHIAMRTQDGTDIMASHVANSIAPGLGKLTVPEYNALMPAQHYRGHSPFFGDQTLFAEVNPAQTGKIQEEKMLAVTFTPLGAWNFLIAPGYIKNAPADQANVYATLTGQTVQNVDLNTMTSLLWDCGLEEFIPNGGGDVEAFLQSISDGRFKVASWNTGSQATLTNSQLVALSTQIASKVAAPAINVAALAAALAPQLPGITEAQLVDELNKLGAANHFDPIS